MFRKVHLHAARLLVAIGAGATAAAGALTEVPEGLSDVTAIPIILLAVGEGVSAAIAVWETRNG